MATRISGSSLNFMKTSPMMRLVAASMAFALGRLMVTSRMAPWRSVVMGEVMSVSPHTNQGIHCHSSLGKHEQGVYIKFFDVGTVSFAEAGDGHDGIYDG